MYICTNSSSCPFSIPITPKSHSSPPKPQPHPSHYDATHPIASFQENCYWRHLVTVVAQIIIISCLTANCLCTFTPIRGYSPEQYHWIGLCTIDSIIIIISSSIITTIMAVSQPLLLLIINQNNYKFLFFFLSIFTTFF